MDHRPGFVVSPWSIGWSGWDTARQAHRESTLALSNGHIGWRGTLDEGDPCEVAGAYLNGVFEEHPMPYAEDGYGYPEHGESIVNVPDGKVIRLLVGDDPLDVREGTLDHHGQTLDLLSGTLHRDLRWTSPSGQSVEVRSTRMVSLTRRSVAAIDYVVTAIDGPVDVTVLSEIVADEPLPDVHPDERVMAPLRDPFELVSRSADGERATLFHRTRRSRIGVAVVMDHVIEGHGATTETTTADTLARTTVRVRLAGGDSIRLTKFVGHESSASLTDAALRDRAEAAVATAVQLGWEALASEQRAFLADFWQVADVVVEGSPRLQQAARFALFQVLQAAARAEVRPVPGKGLTGPGYEGHAFWDAETFMLPVLTYTIPQAARGALQWRHATLDAARERADQLHLAGAAFPWRTISGRECSGYWPAGTVAFHINADIADAVMRYVRATADTDFERAFGLEILVETARLWQALGRWDPHGVFHIDGVTGPDEYSALVDDNLYTNLMAQRNLRAAALVARRQPTRARELGVGDDEIAAWELAAGAIAEPFDAERGVHQQAAGFTERERWDFAGTSPDQYPLQDHFPYFDLYRKQVVKQADLVLALQLAHESFTEEEMARAFEYYEELTVRDSSLSAASQAVVAAWTGHLQRAVDYATEAATIDLDDLRGDIDDGLHIAALAGAWTALVSGFGGMKDGERGLEFTPRLGAPISRLKFGIRVGGHALRVEVTPAAATYTLDAGPDFAIRHYGGAATLQAAKPLTLGIPPLRSPQPAPAPPPGRTPDDVRAQAKG